ncbi:MAG TPA: hypothetical protein VLE43_05250 [Candidatus Saccharimonadia bacterium]|nr:hypothetical protein [Candidatus Saccharimonadia bacterium]
MRLLKPRAGGKLTYDESTPAGCTGILLTVIASPVLLFAIASYFYDWWLWPTLAMLLLQPVLSALPGNAR